MAYLTKQSDSGSSKASWRKSAEEDRRRNYLQNKAGSTTRKPVSTTNLKRSQSQTNSALTTTRTKRIGDAVRDSYVAKASRTSSARNGNGGSTSRARKSNAKAYK